MFSYFVLKFIISCLLLPDPLIKVKHKKVKTVLYRCGVIGITNFVLSGLLFCEGGFSLAAHLTLQSVRYPSNRGGNSAMRVSN